MTKSSIVQISIFLICLLATHFAMANKDEHKSHIKTPEIIWETAPFGPEIWKIKGDLLKGKHITYIKFAAGTVIPLHIHSADYTGIVVTGTTRHWITGKPHTHKLLPPGLLGK